MIVIGLFEMDMYNFIHDTAREVGIDTSSIAIASSKYLGYTRHRARL